MLYNNLMLKKILLVTALLILTIFLKTNIAKAQNVSLSISPPLLEAVIKPGEKIEQTYILKNEGPDTIISADIFPFNQADDFGNPKISRSIKDYDPLSLKYWFSFREPQITLGDKFTLKQGEEKRIVLAINPADNASNGDYYFTLVFRTELDNTFVAPDTKSALSQAEIGSNILITISKDGIINRKAAIKEFKAPKIIDSFSKLNYQVKLSNIGEGFFKPLGKITIESVLGKKYVLNLAPQNIISSSSREISCIENEKLVPCQIPTKFLFGPYRATLSFEIDNNKKIYQETISSFGVPIIPIFLLITLFAAFLILGKVRKKKILLTKKRKTPRIELE